MESSSTQTEVTANRPDIIIKNKKEKTCTLIDVAIPAGRNVVQKGAEKKLKYKSLGRDRTNVEPEMYDHTSNNWSHLNSNTELKEKSASYTRNTFKTFYKRRLYLEYHTHYGKHYSVKLET